jgi:hypothetical protein
MPSFLTMTIVLVVMASGSCAPRGGAMSANNHFLSADELRKIAGATSGAVLPDEDADTLPVPHKDADHGLVILVLYYRESGPPRQRTVKPPHHAMFLDPRSGKVLRFWACRPEDLGIEMPPKPVPGAGIPAGMTSEEFLTKRQRFLDISPAVWEAFASGATELPNNIRSLIEEYKSLFLQITKAEVAPFYVEAAPDFFGWLEQVARNH